jgi:hypothetical protein
MDWINQGKYIKWLIGILLIVNLLTISIIWILITGRREPPPFGGDKKPRGTIEKMKKDIGLSDDQAKQFEKLRNDNFEQVKSIFEKIDQNKKLLARELANDKIDTVLIKSITNKIGLMIAETEKKRIIHFKNLISLCNPEQKAKLLPILEQLVGGKPPMMGKPGDGPMPQGGGDGGMKPPPPGEGLKQFNRPGF